MVTFESIDFLYEILIKLVAMRGQNIFYNNLFLHKIDINLLFVTLLTASNV